MCQYYKGVILTRDYCDNYRKQKAEVILSPHDFAVSSRLIDHSRVGYVYTRMYENLLGGVYFGYPFVWCGDYARDIREHIKGKSAKSSRWKKQYIPYFFESKRHIEFKNETYNDSGYKYLLNITKKCFVDMSGYKNNDLHPLPLLCCNSNEYGRSGEYNSEKDLYKVGTWAYDCIGFANKVPESFTELIVNFQEK